MDSRRSSQEDQSLASDIVGPLETLNNLLYLLAQSDLAPQHQADYMRLAQQEVMRISARVMGTLDQINC